MLAELQQLPNIFSKLTPETNDFLTVRINVAGFSGLAYMANDVLKAALVVLESDFGSSPSDGGPNVATLIDLAIQLMPIQELELVNILHKHHLERQNQL